MKKIKWYSWNGKGEIPEGVEAVILRNSAVISISDRQSHLLIWSHCGDYSDIVAYTKGKIA